MPSEKMYCWYKIVFFFNFVTFYLLLYLCVCEGCAQCVCGSQRTAYRSSFECKLLGLVACTFILSHLTDSGVKFYFCFEGAKELLVKHF